MTECLQVEQALRTTPPRAGSGPKVSLLVKIGSQNFPGTPGAGGRVNLAAALPSNLEYCFLS